MVQLFVKLLCGKTVGIEYKPNTQASNVVKEICDKYLLCHTTDVKYIFAGKLLDLTKTMEENGYNINSDHSSTIIINSNKSERSKESIKHLNATIEFLKNLPVEDIDFNGGLQDILNEQNMKNKKINKYINSKLEKNVKQEEKNVKPDKVTSSNSEFKNYVKPEEKNDNKINKGVNIPLDSDSEFQKELLKIQEMQFLQLIKERNENI